MTKNNYKIPFRKETGHMLGWASGPSPYVDWKDNYEFELSADALEIMPYGVAADLLKSDVSNNYGQIYSQRYESMLQRLDPRYSMGSIYIEGGLDI